MLYIKNINFFLCVCHCVFDNPGRRARIFSLFAGDFLFTRQLRSGPPRAGRRFAGD